MSLMVHVSVQGNFVDQTQWVELAKATDHSGVDCLYVADHLGSSAIPFAALAAAAAVTDRVRLGTCVLNAGLREPLSLAAELATLDALSGGRAIFGVGAGHTPTEWTMLGLEFPRAGERVDRLIELVGAVRLLLTGEPVTTSGTHFRLHEARLSEPHPIQDSIPLLVGGNGRRVLAFAVECADIVGITGLGRTLSDGHSHEAEWSPPALDSTFGLIHSEAMRLGRHPDIEALVQHVEITDEPERVANEIAQLVPGATAADLLGAPFMWIGTPNQIAAKVVASEKRWGITRYVIRDAAIESVGPVLQLLKQSI
jgi:probable F420-dependent oxidoreductase